MQDGLLQCCCCFSTGTYCRQRQGTQTAHLCLKTPQALCSHHTAWHAQGSITLNINPPSPILRLMKAAACLSSAAVGWGLRGPVDPVAAEVCCPAWLRGAALLQPPHLCWVSADPALIICYTSRLSCIASGIAALLSCALLQSVSKLRQLLFPKHYQ